MKVLLLAVAALLAVGFAIWTYQRRELPVGGRWGLIVLRSAALLIALLLLFDPRIPALGTGAPERWVLVDASASMGVGPEGSVPWDGAATRARALEAEGARVLRFGAVPPSPPLDTALSAPPEAPRSLLVPALERAAEAGAREVVVISDLRLEDPVGVRAALPRLGLAARFEAVGGDPRNAGVAELSLPAHVGDGDRVIGEVELFGSGLASGDSLAVEVRQEDRVVWSGSVAPPSPGRTTRLPLDLDPPARVGGGEVRYRATVSLAGDRFPPDDEAVAYTVVDPSEGALVGVSLSPDWELRQLLPVLARVTGLPTRGFLRVGEGYLPLGSGPERGGSIGEAEMAARVRDADFVVIQGLDASAPAWARSAAESGKRVLIFPTDAAGAAAAGVRVATRRPGEWYLDPEPLPSPLIGEIAGLAFEGLPPLTDLLPRVGPPDLIVPLGSRLRGTGRSEAPLLLRQREGGRAALAVAQGWWRWSLRPGPAADAYQRVWSGVSGWLLAEDTRASQRVRPVRYVNPPSTPIEWTSAGIAPLHLTVTSRDSVVTDTTLAEPVDALRTPGLAVGTYRYRAVSEGDTAVGRFDVHAASDELRHPRMAVEDSIPAPMGRVESGGAGRPLRAHALPYLLLVGLLCGEWIARRRKGLR